jgi:hypothetical protein
VAQIDELLRETERPAMKIDLTQPNPTIGAEDLGKSLGLEPAEVLAGMRAGTITSRFESGIDEHAGTHRLTFWYKAIKVRFTCDGRGNVLKTLRTKVAPKP